MRPGWREIEGGTAIPVTPAVGEFAEIAALMARHGFDRGGHWVFCEGRAVMVRARWFEWVEQA